MVIKYLEFLKRNKERIIDIIVLILIISFLLSYFKPSLLFSKTTASGGDTGAHYYPVYYMKEHLIPNLKLSGWDMGWYGGFPIYQYYMPLTSLIIVLISYIIPLEIAFKIGTVLGTFLLPLITFFSLRFILKFKFPIPIISSLMTIPFLFIEDNSMWGGNILSTLAGEFAYSLALSLAILYICIAIKNVENKKGWLISGLLLGLIGLTHLFVFIFVSISSLILLFNKNFRLRIKYLSKIYFLAFLLMAFWVIPLMSTLEYTTPNRFIWDIGLKDIATIFPKIILPVVIFAIPSIYELIIKKDKKILFFYFLIFISYFLFWIGSKSIFHLVNIRFLPFLQLSIVFLSAYMLSGWISRLKLNSISIMVLIMLVSTFLWVNTNVKAAPQWIKWNYEGYEGKLTWNEFKEINDLLLSTSSNARIFFEHAPSFDRFGTIRAFEMLPFFAKKNTLEGLQTEASISAPFIFYIDSELSDLPAHPLPKYYYSGFDIENGTKHLKMFNVKYVIADSKRLQKGLNDNEEYKLLKKGRTQVYELLTNNGKYVEVLDYEPFLIPAKENWKKISYDWFANPSLTETKLVFTDKLTKEEIKRFKLINKDEEVNISNIPKIKIGANCKISEDISNEKIEVITSCPDMPHIIKISYFPNWKVNGAEKIYLVSPSFMLVFPKSNNFTLYYDRTYLDIFGLVLSVIGFLIILVNMQKIAKFKKFFKEEKNRL